MCRHRLHTCGGRPGIGGPDTPHTEGGHIDGRDAIVHGINRGVFYPFSSALIPTIQVQVFFLLWRDTSLNEFVILVAKYERGIVTTAAISANIITTRQTIAVGRRRSIRQNNGK